MEPKFYLSVVVACRNDDHGGGLLPRAQAFFDLLLDQCSRHRLEAELIVVEWNPPADQPFLAEALRWPERLPCPVRFIRVPENIHGRYPHSQALALHQLIAKNVGIRRARGEFVLATNINVLLSEELLAWIAARKLCPDRLYRADRYDVPPLANGCEVGDFLEHCRRHSFRAYRRNGIYPLDQQGRPGWAAQDIAAAADGLLLGEGWFAPETNAQTGLPVRGIGNNAEFSVEGIEAEGGGLEIDCEPGPGTGYHPCLMQVEDYSGRLAWHGMLPGRRTIVLPLKAFQFGGAALRGRIHIESPGMRVNAPDFRLINLLVHRMRLLSGDRGPAQAFLRPAPLRAARERLRGLARRVARKFLTLPVPPAVGAPAHLHTNACGDFTLLSAAGWRRLRGYAEWPVYPLNLDTLLCYSAHHAGFLELVLDESMRVYHLVGTGRTPEGAEARRNQLRSRGVPWLGWEEMLRLAVTMRRWECPLIVNRESWGLKDDVLSEVPVMPGGGTPAGLSR